MNQFNVLPAVCLLLAMALCAWTSRQPQSALNSGGEQRLALWAMQLPPLVPMLWMSLVEVPLPIFYLLLYATSCLPCYPYRRREYWTWLLVQVRVLAFTALHLIALGAMALTVSVGLSDVLADDTLRTGSLLAAVMIIALGNVAVTPRFRKSQAELLLANAEEIRLFAYFVQFCLCAVLFDSVPCLFVTHSQFLPAFLIVSNELMLAMVALFIRHVHDLMQEARRKDEYLRLIEETVLQRIRTAQLEREAYLDALTGIYTRQYVLTNMDDMLQNGERFALAFLDLDGLKKVNDRQGHYAGDRYLQRFAARLRAELHTNDIFARYGGDEFLILFPDCTTQSADERLAALRQAASAAQPQGWGIPFSYGIVQVHADAELSAEEWIALADRMMYEDKRRAQEGEAP